MFSVHSYSRSISYSFKITLGSVDFMPVCLLGARMVVISNSFSEPVTYVNIFHQDHHPSSCHPAWYTRNVMTHRIKLKTHLRLGHAQIWAKLDPGCFPTLGSIAIFDQHQICFRLIYDMTIFEQFQFLVCMGRGPGGPNMGMPK